RCRATPAPARTSSRPERRGCRPGGRAQPWRPSWAPKAPTSIPPPFWVGQTVGRKTLRRCRDCGPRGKVFMHMSVDGEVVGALVRAGLLLAQLHEDVVQERRRTEAIELGRQPFR